MWVEISKTSPSTIVNHGVWGSAYEGQRGQRLLQEGLKKPMLANDDATHKDQQ